MECVYLFPLVIALQRTHALPSPSDAYSLVSNDKCAMFIHRLSFLFAIMQYTYFLQFIYSLLAPNHRKWLRVNYYR